MKLIQKVHQETEEILANLIEAVRKGEITPEERNAIVLSCFKAEAERQILVTRNA